MNLLILEVVWAAAIASQAVLVVAIAFFSVFFFEMRDVYKSISRCSSHMLCYTYGDSGVGEAINNIAISACHGDKMERRSRG